MRNIWLTLAAVNLIMTSSASRHGKKDDASEQLVNTTSCLVRIESEPSVGRRSYKAVSQRDPDLRRWLGRWLSERIRVDVQRSTPSVPTFGIPSI